MMKNVLSRILFETPRPLRIEIAIAVAFVGLVTMFAILFAFDAEVDLWETGTMPAAAFCGAGLAGYVFAGCFGWKGDLLSRILALLGFLLTTATGSFAGGVIWALISFPDGLYQDGVLFGLLQAGALAFVVVCIATPAEYPIVAALWLFMMVVAQFVGGQRRALHADA